MDRRLAEEKVFKDPVHKYIYVENETIWNLINTKEFQRLRRIRQLGASFVTFHGAEHSRFSHSLGVYEITRKIISQFERKGYADWPQEEKLLCLCAALLHDIGHGPFSHSVENVFKLHHEEWTCRMLLGNTEIHQVLSTVSADFPQKVAAVIEKKYPKEIVIGLISSQMDADRMDYLLRDAYFTGVNYGTFDLERILRVLRPYRGHIVVKESGMHTVEDYLMSRYQMYWQVYFHPVTRSSEIILRKIFERAADLYASGFLFQFLIDPLSSLLSHKMTMEEYLLLDESFFQMAMMQWTKEKDPILADLCSRFLHRKLFKYTTLEHRPDPEWMEQVRTQCRLVGIHPQYYLEFDFPTDMPYDVYHPGEPEEKFPILLLNEQDKLTEISQASAIVRSISGIHQGHHRIYYPLDLLREVRESEEGIALQKLLGIQNQ